MASLTVHVPTEPFSPTLWGRQKRTGTGTAGCRCAAGLLGCCSPLYPVSLHIETSPESTPERDCLERVFKGGERFPKSTRAKLGRANSKPPVGYIHGPKWGRVHVPAGVAMLREGQSLLTSFRMHQAHWSQTSPASLPLFTRWTRSVSFVLEMGHGFKDGPRQRDGRS